LPRKTSERGVGDGGALAEAEASAAVNSDVEDGDVGPAICPKKKKKMKTFFDETSAKKGARFDADHGLWRHCMPLWADGLSQERKNNESPIIK